MNTNVAAPLLTLPANVMAKCGQATDPGVLGQATAVDACDTNPVVTHADTVIPGACSNSYTIIRTWTAADGGGNVTNAEQVITVVDTVAPTLSVPANTTIESFWIDNRQGVSQSVFLSGWIVLQGSIPLIIPNHTGQAQVLEERSAAGAVPSLSYSLGDDVISQTAGSTLDTRYLLYAGHGSTRQFVNDPGVITDSYAYDGYGINLNVQSTPYDCGQSDQLDPETHHAQHPRQASY